MTEPIRLKETINEWAEWEIREIRKFVRWWEENSKEDPFDYPQELEEGEFDEQYIMWQQR